MDICATDEITSSIYSVIRVHLFKNVLHQLNCSIFATNGFLIHYSQIDSDQWYVICSFHEGYDKPGILLEQIVKSVPKALTLDTDLLFHDLMPTPMTILSLIFLHDYYNARRTQLPTLLVKYIRFLGIVLHFSLSHLII